MRLFGIKIRDEQQRVVSSFLEPHDDFLFAYGDLGGRINEVAENVL